MRPSRYVIAFFIASFVVAGIIDALLGVTDEILTPTYVPHSFVIAILGFAWCKADVRENRFTMPAASALLCGIIPPIGVPLHLFRTRPLRRAMIGLLKGAGFFAAAFASYELALFAIQTVAT